MSGPRVVIVDYGLGNLFSVERALRHVGSAAVITGDPREIASADRLIIPGVGAFGDGMRQLRERGLDGAIRAYAAANRPLLGVCLGMQLLMSESEEFGLHQGLCLVPGRVVRLQPSHGAEQLKVPHIGWNAVVPAPWTAHAERPWSDSILHCVPAGSFMYFLHSYQVVPAQAEACIAVTHYGHGAFCSALQQGRITGVQFHPERSGEDGLRLYRSFVYDTESVGAHAGAVHAHQNSRVTR